MSSMSKGPAVLLLFLFSSVLFAHPGKVVRDFPAPGKFATGMTFAQGALWLADYQADKLFKIDPATGEVLDAIPSPGFWPMGLAFDGRDLWNVDAKQKRIFRIDPEDGTVLASIEAPSDNPEGLAFDGETLWVSDSRAGEIMRIDLSDGTAVKTLPAPSRSPNGLTFDGAYLWCSDRMQDEIYMIHPDGGEVILVLDAPGPYARGLAFDGERIWNVDHEKDRIYALVREDDELYRLSDPRHAEITFTHEVKPHGQGLIKTLEAFIAVPQKRPGQEIESVTFSPEGYAMEKDRWDQPIACFKYEDLPSLSVTQSIMKVKARISAIRYFILPHRCGSLDDIPMEIVDRYTADGTKYLIDDPFIKETAKRLKGDETNPYWIARSIFDYVGRTLEYKLEGGWNAAPVVLKRGTGSCSEYSFSFIALCRAAGLPARYVGALVVRGDDASLDDVFHRWPEVYLPNYGWVPMDPQGGDRASPRDRALSIGNLSNRFLITTRGGGDSDYLGWYYNYNERYTTDPQVQVNIETFGEWEPLEEEEG